MAIEHQQIDEFTQTWTDPSGVAALSAVNNQPLGKRFMITAFAFFLVGGILALLMRVQLAVSENDFLGAEVYNQLFTMHGSTMMFLFAVPFLEGLALYLLPMMVGSRDVAYPRLTAFGYWVYLFGGLIFYASFLFDMVPDAGWFAYTPLSGPAYSGKALDFWLLGLSMVEIAGIAAGIEIVVTILKLRAPGMTLNRIPLFAWAMLVAGAMIIFAFTVLLTATILLELDRTMGTRFFDPDFGGSTLLWQHLFWFFGHPEVYIIFIPATGVISMIVPVFARRPIAGYILIAVAIVVTGFVSFGLWVHHMFTTGLPWLAMLFFTAASLMIAVASGTQIFAWIATLWGRRPVMDVPMLYIMGFLFVFVIGGITGVMVAILPFNWQVHDTFFIVAHFHYVLIGGVVFPIFAGIHYWYPKFTGRMLHESMGKWSFWLVFIGFNVTFIPMHTMGFWGMPRRVYTYPATLGLDWQNLVATAGSFLLAFGFAVFLFAFFYSLYRGREAGDNPWNADSLEWSLSSPPPQFSFSKPFLVEGRHPLWSEPGPPASEQVQRAREALHWSPANWRATLITDSRHAVPQAVGFLSSPTYTPLFAAIGVLFASVGVLAEVYLVAILGAVFTAGMLGYWLWPRQDRFRLLESSQLEERCGVPVFPTGTRSLAWWGMVCFLVVLATMFGALFYSYTYLRLFSPVWPQDHLPSPEWLRGLVIFGALTISTLPLWWSVRSFRSGQRRRMGMGLAASLVLGLTFLGLQTAALYDTGFSPQTNAYASVYYAISWLLHLVVMTGLVMTGVLLVQVIMGREQPDCFLTLQVQLHTLFWSFTVSMGVLVYLLLYLSPRVVL